MISPMSLIPLETIEHICSFLWEKPTSLGYCSLVCRSWHSLVRPYIFRRVVIDSPERLRQLEALLLSESVIGYWIRELEIVGFSYGEALLSQVFPDKLKKLYAVTLAGFQMTDLQKSGEFIENMSQAFSSTVKSLALTGCRAHEGFFPAFIHAFPLLHDLQLRSVKRFADSTSEDVQETDQFKSRFPDAMRPLRRLTSFTFFNGPYKWDAMDRDEIFHLTSLRTVETLTLGSNGTHRAMKEISQMILPECGQVKTLKLTNFAKPGISHMESYIALWHEGMTHLKQLRCLEMAIEPLHDDFISDFLDVMQGSCHQLETISFQVFFRYPERIQPADHTRLDKQFSSFRALREVKFHYRGPLNEATVRRTLHEAFPSLAATESSVGPKLRVDMSQK